MKPKITLNRHQLQNQFAQTEKTIQTLSNKKKFLSAETIYHAAEDYQTLCSTYGYLHTFFPKTKETAKAQQLLHTARRLFYSQRLEKTNSTINLPWYKRIPVEFRKIRFHVLLAIVIMLLSSGLTALIVSLHPSLGWHFVSEEVAIKLRQGNLWTEDIRGLSTATSSFIAVNNIKVSLLAFALGITAGIGTIIILLINGAQLGAIFTILRPYGMSEKLFEFILAHGILELSIIAVSAGCGLYLGDALINPGFQSRKQAVQEHARTALNILLFSLFCLIIAGLVEGHISPYDHFSFKTKLGIGLLLGSLYWGYLLNPKNNLQLRPNR